MTKMNWSKAKSRRRPSGTSKRPPADPIIRDQAMTDYATKHDLSCFNCQRKDRPWAKTGNTRGRPWAICLPCAQRKSP